MYKSFLVVVAMCCDVLWRIKFMSCCLHFEVLHFRKIELSEEDTEKTTCTCLSTFNLKISIAPHTISLNGISFSFIVIFYSCGK